MSNDSSSNSVKSLDSVSTVHRNGSLLTYIAQILGVTSGVLAIFISSQLIAVVVIVLMFQLAGTPFEQFDTVIQEDITWQFIMYAFVAVFEVGIFYGIYRLFGRHLFKSAKLIGRPSKKVVTYALGFYGLYFLSMLAVYFLVDAYLPSIDVDQIQDIGFKTPQGYEIALTYVALAVLPPLAEEIAFRGVLYQQLKKYSNYRVALILTSLVFAAAHLEFMGDNPLNFVAAIDTFILSLYLIFAYEKSNSLYTPIIIHALKNTVAFVAVYYL